MICCGKSDIGRKRSENQDHYLTKSYAPGVWLAVVCDGMGGVNGGREASLLAVEAFVSAMDAFLAGALTAEGSLSVSSQKITEAMSEAVQAANEAVLARTREDTSLRGMGTTLVSALVCGGICYAVNVGDSRLYRIRGGQIEQITKDHSLVQYLMDIGKLTPQEAAASGNRNIITRAVGIDVSVEADTFVADLNGSGQTFLLLCSDGLSNMVSAEQMAAVLETPPAGGVEDGWLLSRAETLICMANEKGGPDNITVAIIAV